MKNFYNSIFIMGFLIFILFLFLTSSQLVIDSILGTIIIWKNNVFPTLFPFFVLSDILIHYGFVEFISELFKPFMRLFRLRGACAFGFVMSMVSGFPSSAKYVRELLFSGLINSDEASKLMTFSHFSNPLFVIGTISILFLNNKNVGILILVTHYIGNLFVGFVFRGYGNCSFNSERLSIKRAFFEMHKKRMSNTRSFGSVLCSAISNAIDTLLLILGIISLFMIVTTLLDNKLGLPDYYQSILNGLFEMTQGLKSVSVLDIPLKIKGTLSVFFISFGGICVHMQVLGIISDTKIKYFPFFVARIIHSVFSSISFYILFDFFIV